MKKLFVVTRWFVLFPVAMIVGAVFNVIPLFIFRYIDMPAAGWVTGGIAFTIGFMGAAELIAPTEGKLTEWGLSLLCAATIVLAVFLEALTGDAFAVQSGAVALIYLIYMTYKTQTDRKSPPVCSYCGTDDWLRPGETCCDRCEETGGPNFSKQEQRDNSSDWV